MAMHGSNIYTKSLQLGKLVFLKAVVQAPSSAASSVVFSFPDSDPEE